MDNKLTQYIEKNSKKSNARLKYDFMPSVLEIIERPTHIAGTVVVVTIAALLAVMIIWACFSKLEVVVNGTGNVMPEGKLVEVQPLVSGKVEKINVRAGDYVNAGDVLISLENETLDIDLNGVSYNMEWCDIRKEITQERLQNDEYEIPVEKYDVKFANGLYQMILEIDTYKEQKRRRQNDLDEAIQDLAEARQQNNSIMIPTLESRVKSYEDTIISSEKSQKSQLHSQLYSLEREMQGYEAQYEKYMITAQSYQIVAPVSGYVNMLSVVSPGQTLSAGSAAVSIVPSGREMQFECCIADKDRSEISVGMDVTVKLLAFSSSDYGAVKGKVSYISPSTFTNEKYGNVYIVDIDIDEAGMHPEIDLTPGLSGNVEIVTGKRTVMQYFLEPITKGLGESLKEN